MKLGPPFQVGFQELDEAVCGDHFGGADVVHLHLPFLICIPLGGRGEGGLVGGLVGSGRVPDAGQDPTHHVIHIRERPPVVPVVEDLEVNPGPKKGARKEGDEHGDGLPVDDAVGEVEDGHVGAPPGPVHREEPEPRRRQPVQVTGNSGLWKG